jgi:hypothetical protein
MKAVAKTRDLCGCDRLRGGYLVPTRMNCLSWAIPREMRKLNLSAPISNSIEFFAG